jgi:replicative DNA helicase
LDIRKAPDYDPNFRRYGYPEEITKRKPTNGKGNPFWEGTKGSAPQSPYNSDALELAKEQQKPVWICEGEKDTETLWNAGELAIGISSASGDGMLDGVSLDGIPEVIIAFDNDDAGIRATGRLLRQIPFALKVEWPEDKPEGFDVSDLEAEDPEGFVETLRKWVDPFESQASYLLAKYDKDYHRDPDKLLGYQLTKFKNLAWKIDGVQPGFYVVGAETNTGKTAFLCNLTLDLLDSNEGLLGLYFSLDDSREVIFNRLLSISTGIPLNMVQRKQPGIRQQEMLHDGYDHLTALSKEKRLIVFEASDIQDIHQLELEIARYAHRKLFVIIDALYNLDVGGNGDNLRKENIERANKLKAIATHHRIPVICTGELRKKERKDGQDKTPTIHDLMETGKFAYNANLVLLLYPQKWEEYDTSDSPTIVMKSSKNKLSHYRRSQLLRFNRATSKFEEIGEGGL